ncbi:unnamed protein product [Phaedon cochleariae]|uniref:Thaumatin-like protein n=1 Tax=Phaedon cochleariae TaxID=80249 RepID=A0A9P0GLI0_PHACE|nr:unnamed protein product [Phaedon cochleariae]
MDNRIQDHYFKTKNQFRFKMFRPSLIIAILVGAVQAKDFEIVNREGGAIWVGIQAGSGKQALNNGGFKLDGGESKTVRAPDDWAGRFWARTWCDDSTSHCLTGDCGNKVECGGNGSTPPATHIEITLTGSGGLDYYDISLVDGFNVPASVEPSGGSGDGSQYSCGKSACKPNLNDLCPEELKLDSPYGVIGCQSACFRFNTDEYCCRNAYSTPGTCRSSDWKNNYPKFFKDHCPDAYSYAYDDHTSIFSCKAPEYILTFG